jgi:stage II sporulation protein AA (anti-sigma F factor antagonist)
VTEQAGLDVEQREHVQVAHLSGEVDIANARKLEARIARAVPNAATGLVLDLSDTRYFDSAGIRMLFDLHERLSGRSQELRAVVPEDSLIRGALLVTQVEQVVPLHRTVEEALAAMGNGAPPAA